MSLVWSRISLGDLIQLERRQVEIVADKEYQEIGIYCFGRGIFHKMPRSGLEVGDKNLYELRAGDLILQVTFAWEGAMALCSSRENGLYGSTRYPTFRVDEERCYPPFLVRYLCTRGGLEQINKICPGSAGRNRVLNIKRIPEVTVPLPSLMEQRRIVARIASIAENIDETRGLREQAIEESELLLVRASSQVFGNARWAQERLETVLAESPRNGLSPQPEVESNGRPMLRINAVSSSPSRFVDLSAYKMVEVGDNVAEPFVLREDDVFIVRYNGDINRVAKAAIFRGENNTTVVYPDKLMRLRADRRRMLPDFLVYVLGSRGVREQVEELGKTTAGQIGVSGADAKEFVIPVPPLADQRLIVAYLDGLQAKVDALKKLQAETAAELAALMPSILDKAFKGEL